MHLITAIPLDYIPKKAGETFTFFSAQNVTKGSLVEAKINKRLVKLLVLETNNLNDYKASVRKSDFSLSPISRILWDSSFLPKNNYDLSRYLSEYYFEPRGAYLKLMFPLKAWKSLKKNNLTIPEANNSEKELKKDTPIIYWNNEEFEHSLQNIFKKNTGQILILCPTLTHLQFVKDLLSKITVIPVLTYQRDFKIKEQVSFLEKYITEPKSIILGLQSAAFLPFYNLKAIIIVDYRHQGNFSMDQHPYYSLVKVGAMWSKLTGCQLILSSTIPGIELAKISPDSLTHLPKTKKLSIEIVDIKNLSQEMKTKILLAPQVIEQIKEAYLNKKKVLVFLNHKGLSHYIVCRDCGETPKCPHCFRPLSLKERGAGRELLCRRCGYHGAVPNICPNCKSWHLKEIGLGIEAIANQLKSNIPSFIEVKLISQDELENGLGLIDLLQSSSPITVATEIIFKPQTHPYDLTVIVSLDNLLNSPNYLAPEEMLNIIYQLKALTKEKIILQTFEPQREIWGYLEKEPLVNFYADELKERKNYGYPPFAHIVKITSSHKNRLLGNKKATALATGLKNAITKLPLEQKQLCEVAGPLEGNYLSNQGLFFWEIILKLKTDNINLRNLLLARIDGNNFNVEIDPPLGI